MIAECRKGFRPYDVVLLRAPGTERVAPFTEEIPADRTAAYVCANHACHPPVTTPAELAKLLAGP